MDAGLISFSLVACVLVSRQIDNVGLLDGGGKMKADKEVEVEHGLRSAPTQYRLYGRLFLQVKRPNQQYQSTEGNIQDTNQRT